MTPLTKEEAQIQLSKWKMDRRILQCIFIDPSGNTHTSCIGLITELSRTSVRIEGGEWGRYWDYFWCVLDLEDAGFLLGDPSNMPPGRPSVGSAPGCEAVLIIRLFSDGVAELRCLTTQGGTQRLS